MTLRANAVTGFRGFVRTPQRTLLLRFGLGPCYVYSVLRRVCVQRTLLLRFGLGTCYVYSVLRSFA